MNAIHTLPRLIPSFGFRSAIQRLALASICLALAACGGGASPPVLAESAPVVVTQPADQSTVVGNAATFSVTASGTPTPTVQWQQSTDAGVSWVNITAATSTSYTTPATVLADSGKRLRAVFTNALGSVNSNGAVLTVTAAVAGTAVLAPGTEPFGVAVDAAGNLYLANFNQTISKITPAGVLTTVAGVAGSVGTADGTGSAARFNSPLGIAVDTAGNLYVADSTNHTIRKITPAGVVSTLAGLAGSAGSANGAGSAARFSQPIGIAVTVAGTIYVGDASNRTIRSITSTGVVSTLAGLAGIGGSTDGSGSAARFGRPVGVAVDAAGTLYVSDQTNDTVRAITPGGMVSTLAGLAGNPGIADGSSAARFNNPWGAAVDAAGNVYVADRLSHTIRKITPAAVVSTLAGLAGSFGSANGTGSEARFQNPRSLAVDAAGNIYVADSGNNAIRKITPAGVVTAYTQ